MANDYLINNTTVYNSSEGVIFKLNKPDLKIKLSKPGAECLRILIDARNEIISQDTLVKDIWGRKGMVVGPNTLYQHIYMLRKNFEALGIDKSIIKTTPQLGFNISKDFAIEPIEDPCQRTEKTVPPQKKLRNIWMGRVDNEHQSTLIEKLSAGYKLFYLIPITVCLLSSLVNSARQPLNLTPPLVQDETCIIHHYPDNLSSLDVNPNARSRESVCQTLHNHKVSSLASDTICQVGKQGDQTTAPRFCCIRI